MGDQQDKGKESVNSWEVIRNAPTWNIKRKKRS